MSGEPVKWGWLYSHIAQCLGWTRQTIDELTWPEVQEHFEYWDEHPPVHLLVAGYLGYKPKKQESGDFGELIAMGRL